MGRESDVCVRFRARVRFNHMFLFFLSFHRLAILWCGAAESDALKRVDSRYKVRIVTTYPSLRHNADTSGQNMANKAALSSDQVRQRLRQRGETITSWAKRHGYPRKAVYRVMSGADKAWYGRAHEIAVALGLKLHPEKAQPEPTTSAKHRNPQARVAA